MNLDLQAADLVKVGSISGKDVLQMLPISKVKGKQKFVVGDNEGELSCFQMKRGEPVSVFKTPALSGPISCLRIGGIEENTEKVFCASGQTIVGYNKKGKEFFKFESGLSEPIQSLFVDANKIWTATEFVYNEFDDGKDKGFFLSPDRINAFTVEKVSSDTDLEGVLGCQDKYIRVIKNSEVLMKKSTRAPVTALVKSLAKRKMDEPRELVFGLENGAIGQLLSRPTKLKSGWKIPADSTGAAVSTICLYDLTQDGGNDILVGREDGRVQVFGFTENGVELVYEHTESDSIRGIKGAVVSSPEFQEVVACTYSGRVISHTTEPLQAADKSDSYGRTRGTVQRESRIVKLRKEISKLEEKIVTEKEKFSHQNGDYVAIASELTTNSKFVLCPDEAAYRLTVEIPSPIDFLILKTTVPVELLDTETNQAIVSISSRENNCITATYRCQDTVTRIDTRFRTMEGQHGAINAMVVANVDPKSAQVLKFNVKPLSLHTRLNIVQEDTIPKELSRLLFHGDFSMLQVHDWIGMCLPEVPVKVEEDEMTLYFQNTYTGSMLICKYRKGEVSFESDSISTLAILKQSITMEATGRKITVKMHVEVNDESITRFLNLLRPKLDKLFAITTQVNLIDPIKELQLQEEGSELWLAEEYKGIAERADEIRQDYKARPWALQYLCGVLTDFFVDVHKFRGRNVTRHIPKLHQTLDQYSFESLTDFFHQKFT